MAQVTNPKPKSPGASLQLCHLEAQGGQGGAGDGARLMRLCVRGHL